MYSEDELIYDAVIISLDASSNTCVVRFCGYGNKEEQNLDDLLPPLSKKEGKSPRPNGNQSGWAASPGHQVILIIKAINCIKSDNLYYFVIKSLLGTFH